MPRFPDRARSARPVSRPTARLAAVAAVLLAGAGSPARADEVFVAVAANFAAPLARIAPGFTAATGHTLKTASGATGKFYAQIVAGAPFQVLLSADDETPSRLVAEGHAVRGSQFTYAIGRLALWSAQPGLVDPAGDVLASGRFRHLAIANPKTAPYGQAAMEVLRARGLADALAPKLVVGENVGQAYQFVATGNASLGFVALSQVMAATPSNGSGTTTGASSGLAATGSHWVVPAALHGEIRQDAVLLRPGERSAASAALLAHLKTDAVRDMLRAQGYGR